MNAVIERAPPRPDRRGSKSAKRSQITHSPLASAGAIVASMWSMRAARKQQRLALRAEARGVAGQNDLAQRLGARRAAGLAGQRDRRARGLRDGARAASLGRFAGALPAFEGDESSRPSRPPSFLRQSVPQASLRRARAPASSARLREPARAATARLSCSGISSASVCAAPNFERRRPRPLRRRAPCSGPHRRFSPSAVAEPCGMNTLTGCSQVSGTSPCRAAIDRGRADDVAGLRTARAGRRSGSPIRTACALPRRAPCAVFSR